MSDLREVSIDHMESFDMLHVTTRNSTWYILVIDPGKREVVAVTNSKKYKGANTYVLVGAYEGSTARTYPGFINVGLQMRLSDSRCADVVRSSEVTTIRVMDDLKEVADVLAAFKAGRI